MATTRTKIPIGSAPWLVQERRQADELIGMETEEFGYAVRNEMARSLDDVLSRRTRARLFDRAATVRAAAAVAAFIGPELGWDDAQQRAQVDAYLASCAHEQTAGQASIAK